MAQAGNRQPRVSIGLPVYNGERYLAAALDSLLAQTHQDFELIVSDNASTDRTEQIARDYAARDPRIRYSRNETNIGAPRNYMRAFHLASGEYFRWANYDDLSGPEFLERCIEVLDRDPSVVLAYPKTKVIDAEGHVISDYEDNLHILMEAPSQRFAHVLQHLARNNAIYGLTRPAVIRKMRPLGVFIASDVCFMAELSLYGKFWEVPERLFFRRMHPKASSSMDAASLKAFYDPNRSNRVDLVMWRHIWENFRGVLHAPLSAREKSRAIGVLARNSVSSRRTLGVELQGALRQWTHRRPT